MPTWRGFQNKLVTLDCEAPLPVPLDALPVPDLDAKALIGFLKAMEFNTITRRVAELYNADQRRDRTRSAPHAGRRGDPMGAAPRGRPEMRARRRNRAAAGARPATVRPGPSGFGTPSRARRRMRATHASSQPFDITSYDTDHQPRTCWRNGSRRPASRAMWRSTPETSALDPNLADLVGISLALAPGRAGLCAAAASRRFRPFRRRHGAGADPRSADALAVLKPLLEDPFVLKIGQDIKYDWVILKRHGIDMRPFDDTMLISYVLDAGKGPHGMDELAKRHLGHTPMTWGEVAGTGKSKVTFDRVDLDKATAYAAEDADVTLRLWQVLKPRLPAEGRATPTRPSSARSST